MSALNNYGAFYRKKNKNHKDLLMPASLNASLASNVVARSSQKVNGICIWKDGNRERSNNTNMVIFDMYILI